MIESDATLLQEAGVEDEQPGSRLKKSLTDQGPESVTRTEDLERIGLVLLPGEYRTDGRLRQYYRSPFRYPGGKSWLIPLIEHWLVRVVERPSEFIEPFAGGASIGLSVAFEDWADHVTLIELDQRVASVWEVVLSDQAEELARAIEGLDLERSAVEVLLLASDDGLDPVELALKTIVRNRTSRAGILAPGAGLLRDGENGRGLRSRWYPQTLAHRIRDIASLRSKISFVQSDGLAYITEQQHVAGTVFFVDPPYSATENGAAHRLYHHYKLDHDRLFTVLGGLQFPFLLTYDRVTEIIDLIVRHRLEARELCMTSSHNVSKRELVAGKALSWMDVYDPPKAKDGKDALK